MDFAAELDGIYTDLGETVSAPFGDFLAVLSPSDREAWDAARVSTHTLRYSRLVPVTTGMLLTIGEDTYKVSAIPLRINGEEETAELIIQ